MNSFNEKRPWQWYASRRITWSQWPDWAKIAKARASSKFFDGRNNLVEQAIVRGDSEAKIARLLTIARRAPVIMARCRAAGFLPPKKS